MFCPSFFANILVREIKGLIQVPTGAPKWPKTAPKGPRMAQNHQNGSTISSSKFFLQNVQAEI